MKLWEILRTYNYGKYFSLANLRDLISILRPLNDDGDREVGKTSFNWQNMSAAGGFLAPFPPVVLNWGVLDLSKSVLDGAIF